MHGPVLGQGAGKVPARSPAPCPKACLVHAPGSKPRNPGRIAAIGHGCPRADPAGKGRQHPLAQLRGARIALDRLRHLDLALADPGIAVQGFAVADQQAAHVAQHQIDDAGHGPVDGRDARVDPGKMAVEIEAGQHGDAGCNGHGQRYPGQTCGKADRQRNDVDQPDRRPQRNVEIKKKHGANDDSDQRQDRKVLGLQHVLSLQQRPAASSQPRTPGLRPGFLALCGKPAPIWQ
ncbi:hypothetical protein ACFP76_19610 [Paracoccus aerius]|uniref:hypothetical protein n=1 Tax=Paracoccus aerius TaxID=1915382 RepID=UPI00361B3E10